MSALDDGLLLQQTAQGNKIAFNQLCEKYWQTTFTEAHKRLGDQDQAKDIVQEIFTHIWVKRESLQIENLQAYLYVSVRNQVFKLLAEGKKKSPFFEYLENIPSVNLQADANLKYKDFLVAYEALLNTLPPKSQIIFRMRFHDDLSTSEIANQLGIPRKTVQNQLGRAFNQLKFSLAQLFILLVISHIN